VAALNLTPDQDFHFVLAGQEQAESAPYRLSAAELSLPAAFPLESDHLMTHPHDMHDRRSEARVGVIGSSNAEAVVAIKALHWP
jgi:hypothetical protein